LFIGQTAVLMHPRERTIVMSQLHVDQIVTLGIVAVDAKGNQVAFVPDSPPIWVNSNEAAAKSAVAVDGLTNVLTPLADAVGQSTTASVVVTVGGVQFTASVDELIVAGTLAGVKITESFSAPPAA